MTEPSRRYADWKAPPADGARLVWPDAPELLERTRANANRLASESRALVQNIQLRELRSFARRAIGHPDDLLLIATGHQAELYHPGVWVKDVLIDALASRLHGKAMHLAVDTDQVKHLVLRYPRATLPVSDDPRLASASWSALVAAPTARHLDFLEQSVRETTSTLGFRPMLSEFLHELRDANEPDLSRALTTALLRIDQSLGLTRSSVIASNLWASDAFAAFVYHVAAHADRFAEDYNVSLDAYRAETDTRDPNRPMPNVLLTDESVELPFWLDDLASGQRTRPTVFRSDGDWVLQPVDRDCFAFDSRLDGWDAAGRLNDYLRRSRLRLAPRALTLTMFARLCLVDLFVHGIGGGRYDQVTDRIVERHFGIEPPAFAVTTATLLFPTAVGRQRTCLPCLLQEGHRLRHALPDGRKRELVEAIAAAPRRSAERGRLFARMHRALAESPTRAVVLTRWQQRLDDARRRLLEERDEFSRELFYLVQPRERLAALIDAVRSDLSS
jgi:hypothetical protein